MVRFLSAFALLVGVSTPVLAQETGTVRGRVTDAASGAGLGDVQVRVDGTTLGSFTRADGEFVIPGVPAGSRQLIARRVGYAEQRVGVTVPAGGEVTQELALRAVAVTLDAVVTTGTAAPTSKRALGTSIGTVDSAALSASQAVTIDAALQGKIAGAQIVQNSGNPGGGGVSVRLRGTGSIISGAEPLYIVDGVIVDNNSDQLINLGARSNVQNRLADINPNDIERIEVVRGAAAAALYGSRANNGVIQIFTKRGRQGPASITVQSRYSAQTVPNKLDLNMYPFDASGNPVTRYDYQDDIFERGDLYESNVSIEGGTGGTTYYVAGGLFDEGGTIPNTASTRRSARVNLGQELSTKLRMNVGANFVNTHNDFLPNGENGEGGVVTAVIFGPNTYSFYPVGGLFPAAAVATLVNPLQVIEQWKAPQDVNRFIGSANLRYNPLENLAVDYTLGYDGYQLEADLFIPRNSVSTALLGRATAVVRDSRILNSDLVANLTNTLGEELGFTTSVGVNWTEQFIETITAGASDLIPGGELVGAGAVPGAGQAQVELATLGFYAQEALAWRDRLFLTGAIRWDASSTFGPDERWQMFPKLSASYVISDEPWFRSSVPENWLGQLRLRAALGFAGNQPSIANAYARFDTYSRTVFNGRVGLLNDLTLGNEELKPERQREFEFGADWAMLQNRLSFEATYYDKKVTDLLLRRPVSPSSGYTSRFDNIGEISNTGFELLARSINLDRPSLRWETTLTYSANRNKVEKLGGAPFTTGYANRVSEGEPVGYFYGRYYVRNADGSIQTVGGLPVISASTELKRIGDPNPDWLGSILNEFTFARNFRARVLFDGSFGNDVLNFTRRIMDLRGVEAEGARELLPVDHPDYLTPGTLARRFSAFEEYVEDGTFVKLRELSLTYLLPETLAGRLGVQSGDVTLAGRNLYTWTEYRGYDPEVNLFGQNTVERGNDFGAVPIPRSWSLGLRLTF